MACCGKSKVIQTRLTAGAVKCTGCGLDLYEIVSKQVMDRLHNLNIDLKGKNFAMSIVIKCPGCHREQKFKIMIDDLKLKEIKDMR